LTKGHCSENHDTISGDLVVKVTVEEDEEYRREKDDLVSNLQISLADAITGKTIQYTNFDGSLKTIEIKPGTQANDKIIFKNLVKVALFFI
jgi:curved DNA-binding protein